MKNYYRIMLGKGSIHAQAAFDEGFVGLDRAIKLGMIQELLAGRIQLA